jgi:hypothetical protein
MPALGTVLLREGSALAAVMKHVPAGSYSVLKPLGDVIQQSLQFAAPWPVYRQGWSDGPRLNYVRDHRDAAIVVKGGLEMAFAGMVLLFYDNLL